MRPGQVAEDLPRISDRPIDRTAARVAFAPGVQFDCPLAEFEYDAPPAVTSPHPVEYKDLIGIRFGPVKVVGRIGPGALLCRCQCGRYVHRKARKLRAEKPVLPCSRCLKAAALGSPRSTKKRKPISERTGPVQGREWDSPPPTIPPYELDEDLRREIGRRRGAIEIIGVLLMKRTPRGGLALLGRCDCGKYVFRRLKTWLRGRKKESRMVPCHGCQVTESAAFRAQL